MYTRFSRYFSLFMIAVCLVFAMVLASQAGPVKVGIGFSIPPYVIKEQNAGVEVDIIREAFRMVGYDVEFVYLPNLRLPVAFAEGVVDCVASNVAYDIVKDSGVYAYESDTTVVFQNYAITMKKKGLIIQSIEDMSDKSVLAFNNAVKYLGSRFATMAASNERYAELADQALQVRLLYSGRVDVVVSDKRIFCYWREVFFESPLSEYVDEGQLVEYHPVFPVAPRHLSFRNKSLRDSFNRGLSILGDTGRLEILEQKYNCAGADD